MKKWNLIIDVARCHDCNNCFLADKDEFVGNDFPPYSASQPRHGHRWMNIQRKERGPVPDRAGRLPALPCMHCDEAPCIDRRRRRLQARRRHRDHRSREGRGRKEIVDSCPYGAIYWNEEKQLAAEVHRLRPSARRRLDRDPLQPGLPDRRHQARLCRGRRDRGACRDRGPRAVPRRPRHQAARLLQEPLPLGEGLRRGQCRLRRQRRVRRGRHGDRGVGRRGGRRGRRATTSASSSSTASSPTRIMPCAYEAPGYKAAFMAVRLEKSVNLGAVFLETAWSPAHHQSRERFPREASGAPALPRGGRPVLSGLTHRLHQPRTCGSGPLASRTPFLHNGGASTRDMRIPVRPAILAEGVGAPTKTAPASFGPFRSGPPHDSTSPEKRSDPSWPTFCTST